MFNRQQQQQQQQQRRRQRRLPVFTSCLWRSSYKFSFYTATVHARILQVNCFTEGTCAQNSILSYLKSVVKQHCHLLRLYSDEHNEWMSTEHRRNGNDRAKHNTGRKTCASTTWSTNPTRTDLGLNPLTDWAVTWPDRFIFCPIMDVRQDCNSSSYLS